MSDQVSKFKKKYLLAFISAMIAGFMAINLYPEHHGLETVGRLGLLVMSSGIIAMLAYIVHQGISMLEPKSEDGDEQPTTDAVRLKKMFYLWSGFSVLLSFSLLRYPLWQFATESVTFDLKSTVSVAMGGVVILFTVFNVVTSFRK